MQKARVDSATTLNEFEDQLEENGYPVWYLDETVMQIELSVCRDSNGKWKFSKPENFSRVCGNKALGNGP